ncbi:5'-nucleotidase, partial [Achromatium sp. WMS2]
IQVRDEALFDYRLEDFRDFNPDTGRAFKPYTIREVAGAKIAIIGQAFPYTPIANPQRFIPDWTFGIQEQGLQELIEQIRTQEHPAIIVLLSHNGMDVDLKLASRVSGIDIILGGHTHDGIPAPIPVHNPTGTTMVTNAGSNGKFLGVVDIDIKNNKLHQLRYRLLPVFSNLLPANPHMQQLITHIRAPYLKQLQEPLAITTETLYRRGTFNGTFDQIICDALRHTNDAQISLSPGFRWGTSVLPGQTVTMEDLLNQTCITYPETYRREMTGAQIKMILEDVCDNLFNPDPYVQQGGDMVRVGGLDYTCDPTATIGHRIQNLTLDDGTKLEANKTYTVAGWATVNSQAPGRPVWEPVAEYLRLHKTIKLDKINTPKLINM